MIRPAAWAPTSMTYSGSIVPVARTTAVKLPRTTAAVRKAEPAGFSAGFSGGFARADVAPFIQPVEQNAAARSSRTRRADLFTGSILSGLGKGVTEASIQGGNPSPWTWPARLSRR